MGVRKKKESVKWTEERMQQKLRFFRSTPRYLLQNLYVFGWESDLLFLSKSGFWTEIEIKVSRADFKAEFRNKTGKHEVLSDTDNHHKPNQFFYAVPEGLVQPDEVPPYVGLLVVRDNCFSVQTLKSAPWLHRHRISPAELELTDKFYYNMVNAQRDAVLAKRTARELTDAFAQGIDKGRDDTLQAAIRTFITFCPHRVITEEGRIHCHELDKTGFGLCTRALCRYLDDRENDILHNLGRR